MTTKDNKQSCQSSTSDENSIHNQVLLLQQLNNANNSMYSASPRANQLSSVQAGSLAASGCDAFQQNASAHSKAAGVNAQSSSAASQHGRWTKEEHQKFLEGLNIYGKNWKKVEEHIGTRTGAQIRSHAQKFFNRLEKEFGKTNVTKDLNANSASAQQSQQIQQQKQQNQISSSQANSSLPNQIHSLQQNAPTQQLNFASAIQSDYAKHLLKNERQQDFYEDMTPMISHLNSSPESGDILQNPLHLISQNNSASINIKPVLDSSIDGAPKKKNWSQILSAQEKMKQQALNSNNSILGTANQNVLSKKEKKFLSKNEKRITDQLSQLLDQQCQHLTQNIPYENQANKEVDFDSFNNNGVDQEVSPSDFISQSLLNSIFEPADIETHLIQFYIAQMNLEQLISQKKQYDLNEVSPYMQNQIKKKKLSIDSISTSGGNNMNFVNNLANNLDNISTSQLSHSTGISATSPSSSAFSAARLSQNKIAQPQPNNFAAVQQNRNQNIQKNQLRNSVPKQANEDISQISEYQQSLLLFNLLQGLTNSQQQNQPTEDLQKNSRKQAIKEATPKFNQPSAVNNSSQNQDQSDEVELFKHLLVNLQQRQANQFNQSYPNQSILSQKQGSSTNANFKTPSLPNTFNAKNDQTSLNFMSTEEEEDDDNSSFDLIQKQLMQFIAPQKQTIEQNPSLQLLNALKNGHF
ncbi:Myb-like DNA-binding domain, shaqkyf class protein (macronuclear) [Tetrahymena thermophila SB210]|uniref:Myb-like DNA-binding domain, shaqkyf class protein n=1 Tax=Tetrahymena thermophila (strain SB210) TaxID=312017 RepID=Q22NF2_TETTS|nr:Myb-like DNA-binding domain, shaqkyf class protein [Tetrahymena thermophila SB210]EAR86833.3 Myb-like DNA-binding domain, shaqkyf class protein [Tetrahymena thermophila SB210]|eukprot:XP_001007078.3 Myb-like DNA-binding domain, shaqkyf class protein [Tetrahymena thermophila SB210]